MTKLIAPNGCLFCELPKPVHWSRLDGLHPAGVWTWVEPSDKVRLQRMKRNRAIRKASTMDIIGLWLDNLPSEEWLGKWVTYHGTGRINTLGMGKVFKVVQIREDGYAVGFDTLTEKLEWSSPACLRIAKDPTENPAPMTTERAEEILNPHSNTLDSLDAEIKRLEEKLVNLRNARQVIAGL